MKKEKLEIKNNLKSVVLLHDGLENEFIKKINDIQCPFCDGKVNFSLYNSGGFNDLNEEIKTKIANKISGLKLIESEKGRYKYKNKPVRYFESTCSNNAHHILTVFTFEEFQPARYISYLVGVLDNDLIKLFKDK